MAVLIRPTRLAFVVSYSNIFYYITLTLYVQICFHVVLNSICIVACIVAGGLAGTYYCRKTWYIYATIGLYGTAIYLPTYNSLTVAGSGSGSNILCIFSQQSQLYSDEFRIIFRPLDSYVPSCNDLSEYWTYLIAIMSLCFVGCVISVVAIFTNCITPCVEDRYSHSWRAKTPES